MKKNQAQQDDDDIIDILALRRVANFTPPPPGLSLGLSKINPRFGDFIVPSEKRIQVIQGHRVMMPQAQQGKEFKDIFDEYTELTEQMRYNLFQKSPFYFFRSFTTTQDTPIIVVQKVEPRPRKIEIVPKQVEHKGVGMAIIAEQSEKTNSKSRQIQNEYQSASLEQKNIIFEEKIRSRILIYALDKYDHYILEKVLDVGPLGHKQWIFEKIYELRDTFCQDQYASKVFQKCIEISAKESKNHFVLYVHFLLDDQIQNKILCIDKIGSQIIQKCLEVFEGDYLYTLIQNLQRNIVIGDISDETNLDIRKHQFDSELCTNQFGCLIVNKIIEIYPKQIEVKNKILINKIIEKVINSSSCLARRQYSNYIVQQILEKVSYQFNLEGQEIHKRFLLDQFLLKDFVNMSMDKYGSNVTEKAVIFGGSEWRARVWNDEISIAEHVFKNLVNDHFANYVMQRVYDYIANDKKNQFYQLLTSLNRKQQLNTHGNIVIKYVEQKLVENHQTNQIQTYTDNFQQSYPQYNQQYQQQYMMQQHYYQQQQQLQLQQQQLQQQYQFQQNQQFPDQYYSNDFNAQNLFSPDTISFNYPINHEKRLKKKLQKQ